MTSKSQSSYGALGRPTRTSDMTDKFKVKEKLGRGAFATVRRAVRKSDGKAFALKCVRKKGMDEYNRKALESEVNIMLRLQHENIVTLHELFDTPNHLHMIIDLLSGGELFDRIVEKGHFSEKNAASIIKQITNSLDYLHSNNIVHRDLKPENLLYVDKEGDRIMLVDFGLAKQIKGSNSLSTPCGSPAYVAPEVLERKPYGAEVDWWSLGVILYILLCGFPPFHDEHNNLKRLYKKIKKGNFQFVSPYWDTISEEAKDLVSNLLNTDPKKRFGAKEVLAHRWLKNNIETSIGDAFNIQLRNHQLKATLRRGVNTVLAVCRMIDLLRAVQAEKAGS